MESAIFKMLTNLVMGMSLTEAFSLFCIIAFAVVMSVKGTLRFLDFIQKNKSIEHQTDLKQHHKSSGVTGGNIDSDQILIQLNLIRDKLVSMELKTIEQRFEMPKELQRELEHISKSLDEKHEQTLEGQKNILKMISSLEDVLVIIKEKLIMIEQQLPSLKSDSKDVLKDVNQNVQSIAKDLATLQGTILGNFSTRNSR